MSDVSTITLHLPPCPLPPQTKTPREGGHRETGCNREGCTCKGFSPNLFEPKYCSFCTHMFNLHFPLPEPPPSPRSNASRSPALPSLFLIQNLNASGRVGSEIRDRSPTTPPPVTTTSPSRYPNLPSPRYVDLGGRWRSSASEASKRASLPYGQVPHDDSDIPHRSSLPLGVESKRDAIFHAMCAASLPVLPTEGIHPTPSLVSSSAPTRVANDNDVGEESVSTPVVPRLSLKGISPPDESTKDNSSNNSHIRKRGNKGVVPPLPVANLSTSGEGDEHNADKTPPPLRRRSVTTNIGSPSRFDEGLKSAGGRSAPRVEDFYFKGTQSDTFTGLVRRVVAEKEKEEKAWEEGEDAKLQEQLAQLKAKMKRMKGSEKKLRKREKAQMIELKSSVSLLKQMLEMYEVQKERETKKEKEREREREKEKNEEDKKGRGGRLWKKSKSGFETKSREVEKRKKRESLEREESLKQLREWRKEEERKLRMQVQLQKLKKESLGEVEQDEEGDDWMKSLKTTIEALTSKIQKMKHEEREQNERRQKKLTELESKVESLAEQMVSLKKQTSQEVEELRLELENTKKTSIDEIEKGLKEEEYSSLAALLLELEQKPVALDSETKATLGHLLLSLSNEEVPVKRRITISFTVGEGNKSKEEPQLHRADLKKHQSVSDIQDSPERKRRHTLASGGSPPSSIRDGAPNSAKKPGKRNKIQPVLSKDDKGGLANPSSKKSSKFLLQMRSPRVKEKAKRFSARVLDFQCYMSNLPDTLLNRILSFLDGKSVALLGCVSAHLRRLCNSEMLWETLYSDWQRQAAFVNQSLLRDARVVLAERAKTPRTPKLSTRKDSNNINNSDGSDEEPNGEDETEGVNVEEESSTNEETGFRPSSPISWKLKYKELVLASRKEHAMIKFLAGELAKTKTPEKEKEKEKEKEMTDEMIWHGRLHSTSVKGRNTQPQFGFIAKKYGRISAGETVPLRILMFSVSEDSESSPVRVPFILTKASEGRRHEPAYHCNGISYGKTDQPLDIRCDPDQYYSLINYNLLSYPQHLTHTFYAFVLYPPEWTVEMGVRKAWQYDLSIKGEWDEDTAGGCLNEETFEDNPFYLLSLPKTVPRQTHVPLCIMLEQKNIRPDQHDTPGLVVPYPYYIGFYVFNSELSEQLDAVKVKWKNCQKVHYCFHLNTKKHRKIMIVPTTFQPGQETSFTLHVYSDYQLTLESYEGES